MRDFIEFMRTEKKKAGNTLIAYERDLKGFEKYLAGRGKTLEMCSESDAVAYVLELSNNSKSKATINRKTSVLRTYYDWQRSRGMREDNPFADVRSSKTDKRVIRYLTVAEMEHLLSMPDDSPKGIRDRALLEFMYGTGARVTEVVRLQFADINIRMGFVTLKDVNEESRIVPLGKYARSALAEYFGSAYEEMKGEVPDEDDPVFVNMRGEALTRQGIWKILKDYGQAAGTEEVMTPQIMRDSFAVHILQNGGDLKTLQELMGFDDLSVGIAYLAVTEIHVRDVYSRTHPRA